MMNALECVHDKVTPPSPLKGTLLQTRKIDSHFLSDDPIVSIIATIILPTHSLTHSLTPSLLCVILKGIGGGTGHSMCAASKISPVLDEF